MWRKELCQTVNTDEERKLWNDIVNMGEGMVTQEQQHVVWDL